METNETNETVFLSVTVESVMRWQKAEKITWFQSSQPDSIALIRLL